MKYIFMPFLAIILILIQAACTDDNGNFVLSAQALHDMSVHSDFKSSVATDQVAAYQKYCSSNNLIGTQQFGNQRVKILPSDIISWCETNRNWYSRALHERNMEDPEYRARYEAQQAATVNNKLRMEADENLRHQICAESAMGSAYEAAISRCRHYDRSFNVSDNVTAAHLCSCLIIHAKKSNYCQSYDQLLSLLFSDRTEDVLDLQDRARKDPEFAQWYQTVLSMCAGCASQQNDCEGSSW